MDTGCEHPSPIDRGDFPTFAANALVVTGSVGETTAETSKGAWQKGFGERGLATPIRVLSNWKLAFENVTMQT